MGYANFDTVMKAQKKNTINRQWNRKISIIKHTLKFGSLFSPSTLKDISLLFRNTKKYNSVLLEKPNKRILVKQSYIFLVWVKFLVSKDNLDSTPGGSIPSFFIYPFRNYRTTITKSPMAHKTYSQEQFMVRFYNFSISFNIPTNPSYFNHKDTTFGTTIAPNNVSKSIFMSHLLRINTPFLGTNMLFLHRYNITFYSIDLDFFKLFNGHPTNSKNKADVSSFASRR